MQFVSIVGEALRLPLLFRVLRVRLNGTTSDTVRIRPTWIFIVGLYRAGGYEPPLQFRRGAVGIRPTRFIIFGLYRTGGW